MTRPTAVPALLRKPVDLLRGKTICFLAGTLGKGGAEQQVYYIVRALQAAGASPFVLALTRGEYWEGPILELGVPIQYVGKRANRISRLTIITAALRTLRPDLIQSAHFYTNIYAAVAGRILRIPAIGAVRSDLTHEIAGHGALLGRASFRLPRSLIANSQAAVECARLSHPAVNIALLPNCVDTDHFQPGCPKRISMAPVLLSVGRLVRVKRHDRFIRLVARLGRELATPFRAVLCGGGPLEADLRSLASQLGLLPPLLDFTGSVNDVSEWYRNADALILASEHEGTPNVILEAMASGLPVVSTAVGGALDLVREGETGFLSPAEDEETLFERTKTLVLDGVLRQRMGANARAYVLEHCSHFSLGDRLAEAYESLGVFTRAGTTVV